MELEQLLTMKQQSDSELLDVLIEKAQSATEDAESSLKGNKAAGVRVRDAMQDIKLIADFIRDNIQTRKGVPWGDKRKHSLDKAIEQAQEREKNIEDKIQKRKQKRISQIGK